MKKVTIISAIALSMGIALSGCASNSEESNSNNTSTSDTNYEDSVTKTKHGNIIPAEVKTKDGHTVQCLVLDGYESGGLDCDWDNKQ